MALCTRTFLVGLTRALLLAPLWLPGYTQAFEDFQREWHYRGTITSPGTRSEGFVGHLDYQGVPLPGKFQQVISLFGEFKYLSAGMPWQPSGWIKTTGLERAQDSSAPFAPSGQEAPHWYAGERRRGTPAHWLYLPTLHYWLDPGFITEFSDTVLKDANEPDTTSFVDEAQGLDVSQANGIAFDYEVGMTNAGSRSAGEEGRLYINGRPVRDMGPITLKTPIGTFYNLSPTQQLWDPHGWFVAPEEVAIKQTTEPFTHEIAAAGKYSGPKRLMTPGDWCYSPQTDTWYAPSQLTR